MSMSQTAGFISNMFMRHARKNLRLFGILTCVTFAGSATACKDLAGSQGLPAGTTDPNAFKNEAGALALYHAAIYSMEYSREGAQDVGGAGDDGTSIRGAFIPYVFAAGILSDELQPWDLGGSSFGRTPSTHDSTDARRLPELQSNVGMQPYGAIHSVRALASQAIGALAAFAPNTSPALRGHLYALQGYADIMFGELYCAGVPLSTLDFDGDYTFKAGSSTEELFHDAVAKFDTAIALSSDSTRILNLARVGKGRALLNLGQYAAAAQAVAEVPTDFTYEFAVDWINGGENTPGTSLFKADRDPAVGGVVSDREGINGLPYRSSGDPRVTVVTKGTNFDGQIMYEPVRYQGTNPIAVANGTEARLIEAEAALNAGGDWLGPLNALRAGNPLTSALPLLADPGTRDARIDTLFQERAYWLYLTGHRQGDLRRLIRQYHRPQSQVYPTGPYPLLIPTYGSDVNLPIPSGELPNPLFTGCFDRNA